MKTLKTDWLIWLMLLAPFACIVFFWNRFPDQIPVHFGMDGKPDDWSDKNAGLLLMPCINVLLYFVFLALPVIDPSKEKFRLFLDKYRMIRMVLHLFFSFIFFAVAFYSLGYISDLSVLILYGTLALFLLLGNYMGNVRHNYFVGIRTPWTLANETVWTKTHRLTAKLWVFSALGMMVILPFFPDPEVIFLPYILLISLIPIVYSYVVFKKITDHEH